MKTVKRAIDPLNLFNPGKVNEYTKFEGFTSQSHQQLYPEASTPSDTTNKRTEIHKDVRT